MGAMSWPSNATKTSPRPVRPIAVLTAWKSGRPAVFLAPTEITSVVTE
jgi:hypothetical protein